MSVPANLVFAPEQVREIDRNAIGQFGIPGFELMRRAAQATFDAARGRFPGARRWRVVCGSGNNAGDGLLIGSLARAAGLDVETYTVVPPTRLAGDAALALREYRASRAEVREFRAGCLTDGDLIVDALLGTGLRSAPSGEFAAAIAEINGAGCPVVAVDVPSGLNSSTGQVDGVAVRADLTVTYVGLKSGLFLGAGPAHAGHVLFADLEVPAAAAARQTPVLRLVTLADVRAVLPVRHRDAHKGDFGHVVIIGGNVGMSGAACLAGEAALRSGAGLVSVATHPAHASVLNVQRPELMCHGIQAARDLAPLLERATVVAVGPGLGRDAWAREMLSAALGSRAVKVVDADALNLVAESADRRDDWIPTPHPGEAGRLLGCTSAQVQADRLTAVTELAERRGGTVVLKGARTLVATAGQTPFVVGAGNPGMATAGMGDVLTGVIAGLVAQSQAATLPRQRIVAVAAHVHALAGDATAAAGGERGVIASDVIAKLRQCVNP